jgi:hypothetical protein
VITYDEARRAAQRRLGASRTELVIIGEQEFADGWVFFYDSVEHQRTGRIEDALGGNAPILIDRETGQFHRTGTARPVEDYIEEHAQRKRRVRAGWPDDLDDRFVALLGLVRDGMGLRDARHLDLLLSSLRGYPPREAATLLDELVELERRGLVDRRPGGSGYRWKITEGGLGCLTGRAPMAPPAS